MPVAQFCYTLTILELPGDPRPQTDPACDELGAVGGDFGQLRGAPIRFCQFIYKPVTVAADGIWNGAPVSYHHTFPNACMEQNSDKYVSGF
jgi:hypothetical protein